MHTPPPPPLSQVTLPRRPEAVVFDMDGLLIDTVPLYAKAMIEAGHAVGRSLPHQYVMSLAGLLGNELRLRLTTDLGETFPVDGFLAKAFERVGPILEAGAPLKRGARDLVSFLRQFGIPIAIATSTCRRDAEHQLRLNGLAEAFAHVIGSDDVPRRKPYPDVYRAAAHALDVDPARCLALEDSFSGVLAASAAGVMTIMVPDALAPTPEIEAQCVAVAKSLLEVLALLRAQWSLGPT